MLIASKNDWRDKFVYRNNAKLHIRILRNWSWGVFCRKIYKYMFSKKNITLEYKKKQSNTYRC